MTPPYLPVPLSAPESPRPRGPSKRSARAPGEPLQPVRRPPQAARDKPQFLQLAFRQAAAPILSVPRLSAQRPPSPASRTDPSSERSSRAPTAFPGHTCAQRVGPPPKGPSPERGRRQCLPRGHRPMPNPGFSAPPSQTPEPSAAQCGSAHRPASQPRRPPSRSVLLPPPKSPNARPLQTPNAPSACPRCRKFSPRGPRPAIPRSQCLPRVPKPPRRRPPLFYSWFLSVRSDSFVASAAAKAVFTAILTHFSRSSRG